MSTFPISRKYPPRRVVYRGADRTLVLRPWGLDDVDALLSAVDASEPELKAFMTWAHLPRTREGEYELVARFSAQYQAGQEYVIGAFDGDGAVVGGAGLHPRTSLNPRALEIGYWCHSTHAGKGWTTLVARVLIAVAFDHFDADRVQVTHDEVNVGSRRVVEKCGFTLEGTMRNIVSEVSPELRAGGYRGTSRHLMWALTPEDLPRLSWLPELRARLTIVDALGGERAS